MEINKVMTFCEQIKESPNELLEVAFGIARFSSYKIDNEYANAEGNIIRCSLCLKKNIDNIFSCLQQH